MKLYKNWTTREKLISMLRELYSATEHHTRSKYVCYVATLPAHGVRYFLLGANGAVRVNTKPAAANSISFTGKFHAMLAKYELERGL